MGSMNGAWWVIVNRKKKDRSWVSKVERRSGKGEELRSIPSKYIGFNSLKLIKNIFEKRNGLYPGVVAYTCKPCIWDSEDSLSYVASVMTRMAQKRAWLKIKTKQKAPRTKENTTFVSPSFKSR